MSPHISPYLPPQELPDERIDELLGLTRKRRERKKRKHEAGDIGRYSEI